MMSLDYFFHEKHKRKLLDSLLKYQDAPAVAFPQYQFFSPNYYSVKTRIALALNKNFIKIDLDIPVGQIYAWLS